MIVDSDLCGSRLRTIGSRCETASYGLRMRAKTNVRTQSQLSNGTNAIQRGGHLIILLGRPVDGVGSQLGLLDLLEIPVRLIALAPGDADWATTSSVKATRFHAFGAPITFPRTACKAAGEASDSSGISNLNWLKSPQKRRARVGNAHLISVYRAFAIQPGAGRRRQVSCGCSLDSGLDAMEPLTFGMAMDAAATAGSSMASAAAATATAAATTATVAFSSTVAVVSAPAWLPAAAAAAAVGGIGSAIAAVWHVTEKREHALPFSRSEKRQNRLFFVQALSGVQAEHARPNFQIAKCPASRFYISQLPKFHTSKCPAPRLYIF